MAELDFIISHTWDHELITVRLMIELFLVILFHAILGFIGYGAAKKRSKNPWLWASLIFFSGLFLPIVLPGILLFALRMTGKSYPEDSRIGATWPDAPDIDYRHFFHDTGIAVDRKNEKLYLRSSFNGVSQNKVYPFSEIRTWRTNIQTGGHVYNSSAGINEGLAIVAHNARISRMNEYNSGLFIEVRDIEFPEWRIAFPVKAGMDLDLNRWMEILRQVVNE